MARVQLEMQQWCKAVQAACPGGLGVNVYRHASRPAEPCRANLAGQLTLPPRGREDAEPLSFLRLRQNRYAPRAAATITAVTADV